MNESLPIAAIVHAGKQRVDDTLIAFIDDLTAHGWKVRGLVPGPLGRPTIAPRAPYATCIPAISIPFRRTWAKAPPPAAWTPAP